MDFMRRLRGISPSTSSSNAEVGANQSWAAALLGAGLADDRVKVEEETTGTSAADGVSGTRTTLAPAGTPEVSGRFGAGGGRGRKANRGHGRCAALNLLDPNRMHAQT